MGTRASLAALTLLGALAVVPPRSVEAGQLKISPVRLDLGVDRPIGTVTVGNPGAEPMLLHLQVRAWDHAAGGDRYLDTRDVLLNPMIFELRPNQQQLVRIGLAGPLGHEREQAYRLFIREVPRPAQRSTRQISTVLNVSLPVFVAPRAGDADAPVLVWRLERSPTTGLALWVENRGNLHAEVSAIALQRRSGEQLAAVDRRVYVLPGQSRRLQVAGRLADPDEPLTLTAMSRSGPLRTALNPGQSAPVEGALR